MLKLYLHQDLPELHQDIQSLPPSCRDPLGLIAKVSSVLFYHTNMVGFPNRPKWT